MTIKHELLKKILYSCSTYSNYHLKDTPISFIRCPNSGLGQPMKNIFLSFHIESIRACGANLDVSRVCGNKIIITCSVLHFFLILKELGYIVQSLVALRLKTLLKNGSISFFIFIFIFMPFYSLSFFF